VIDENGVTWYFGGMMPDGKTAWFTQRPVNIPRALLREDTQLFIFNLSHPKDLQALRELRD
jgi:hypothetical protein